MLYGEKGYREKCYVGRNVIVGEMLQGETFQGELLQGELSWGKTLYIRLRTPRNTGCSNHYYPKCNLQEEIFGTLLQ